MTVTDTFARALPVVAALADDPATSDTKAFAWKSLIVFAVILVVGMPILLAAARLFRTINLALGFGATAVLWALGYCALMRPGFVAGEALFALMLAVLFGAGFVAGRFANAGARPSVVGLVSAVANLLVVGAFLRGLQSSSQFGALVWVAGLVAVSVVLAWLGGLVGKRMPSNSTLPSPAALFATVFASTIFLLIVLGGVLTGYEAGLAVPDWPNSFGHNMLLYPVAEMKEGVFYEHAHRLYGMLVGATAVVFISVTWREPTARWVRTLAIVLLVMIIVQGILGGMRVTGRPTLDVDRSLLAPSTALAIVHGVFAQLVFAAALVVAAGSSRLWESARANVDEGASALDRGAAILLPAAFVLQLILGALYRHLQPGGGATAAGHPTWAIHAHMTMAVVVTGWTILAAGRAWAHRYHPVLATLGKALVVGVSAQLILGIIAVALVWMRKTAEIPTSEVLFTTLHQGLGALLLGLSALLAAWSWRLLPQREPAPQVAAPV